MKIAPVNTAYTFASSQTTAQKSDKNPISKTGEKAKLVQGVFVAGLGLGTRLLFELVDDFDFIFEKAGDKAVSMVDKAHKNVSSNKRAWLYLGAWAGLVATFVAGVAFVYTLFKAPKINYEGNINAFKKGKDMDVYIKGNEAEKEIYTQMNEKAKNANGDEKEKLRQQYMQMQAAKNKVPDFVQLKNDQKA